MIYECVGDELSVNERAGSHCCIVALTLRFCHMRTIEMLGGGVESFVGFSSFGGGRRQQVTSASRRKNPIMSGFKSVSSSHNTTKLSTFAKNMHPWNQSFVKFRMVLIKGVFFGSGGRLGVLFSFVVVRDLQ